MSFATCKFETLKFYQEVQKRDQINQLQQQQQQQQHHLTYSQKQALKDFDAYELKNLELENKKVQIDFVCIVLYK